jgi:hypothetical protein
VHPARVHIARLACSLIGLLAVACVLVLPFARAHAAPAEAAARTPNAGDWGSASDWGESDGEACDEHSETAPELIACGGELDWTPGEPVLVSLLRAFDLHMSKAACSELLYDIWSGEACEVGSLECGELSSAVPPSPSPKLASSSASARASVEALGLGLAACRRLEFSGEDASLSSRDLPPPVPPPKLAQR